MVTLLHMLLAEADRSLDGCETVCQDLLEVLLIWLVRCTTLSLQVEESPRSDNRECVEIKRYLDNNYREDISLIPLPRSPTSTNIIWPTPSRRRTAFLPSPT